MIRKIIVIAFAVLALWATPAAAQYSPGGEVGGTGVDQGGGSVDGTGTGADGGSLARTGSDITDLAPYGAVMLVAGGLIVVAAKRRTPELA